MKSARLAASWGCRKKFSRGSLSLDRGSRRDFTSSDGGILTAFAPHSFLILFQRDQNRGHGAGVYVRPPGKKLQSGSRWFFERYVRAAVEHGSFPQQLAPSPSHRFRKLER